MLVGTILGIKGLSGAAPLGVVLLYSGAAAMAQPASEGLMMRLAALALLGMLVCAQSARASECALPNQLYFSAPHRSIVVARTEAVWVTSTRAKGRVFKARLRVHRVLSGKPTPRYLTYTWSTEPNFFCPRLKPFPVSRGDVRSFVVHNIEGSWTADDPLTRAAYNAWVAEVWTSKLRRW